MSLCKHGVVWLDANEGNNRTWSVGGYRDRWQRLQTSKCRDEVGAFHRAHLVMGVALSANA
ncbi:MAG: hypothetical protein VW875_17900 [Planctomycetaceae bacterium]